MTHYSNNPGSVRVDFFTGNGKWKYDAAIDMSGHYAEHHDPRHEMQYDLHECLSLSLDADSHWGAKIRTQRSGEDAWEPRWRLWLEDGGMIICLEPYHERAYPIMLTKNRVSS